ncbi:MAG: hypothetical protein Q9191_004718 [Dirinaria sp. TL-2023a]
MIPAFPKPCPLYVSTVLLKPAQRSLSYSSLPPPRIGFTQLTSRRLIALAGKDAPHFLQGLTTRNIAPRDSRHDQDPFEGFYSAFLNAAGRVLHDVFIYPGAHHHYLPQGDDPGFLIDVDANEAERLRKHLKKFQLKAKVQVEVLDQQAYVWSLWQEEKNDSLPRFLGRNIRSYDGKIAYALDARADGMGARVVLPHGKDPIPDMGAEECSLESYHVRRVLNGVAEGQGEIRREAALPLESNMDYMGGIDFRKGCYVGQELTIRTHHTGVVRKRILPVQLYDSDRPPEHLQYDAGALVTMPPSGTDIKRLNGEGRSTGKWLGGVGNLGLALCRLENMTDITLTGESNQWHPELEFAMSWGQEGEAPEKVKVKAFIPHWHRNRSSARDIHNGILNANTS